MNHEWFEVWSDESFPDPYILIVQPVGELVVVTDPRLKNEVIFRGPDYDSARFWLLEDEFSQVRGRVICE